MFCLYMSSIALVNDVENSNYFGIDYWRSVTHYHTSPKLLLLHLPLLQINFLAFSFWWRWSVLKSVIYIDLLIFFLPTKKSWRMCIWKFWKKCVKEILVPVWNSLCLLTSILWQKQQISFRKFVLEIYYEVNAKGVATTK